MHPPDPPDPSQCCSSEAARPLAAAVGSSAQAARERDDKLAALFELPTVGIAITSPGKDWRDVNDAWCRMIGYSREELAQRDWASLTHQDDLAADVGHFERLLAGEIGGYTLEKRFVRKDGSLLHALVSVSCVRDADASLKYLVALGIDITARHRAETARRESQDRLDLALEAAGMGAWQMDLASGLRRFDDRACRLFGLDPATFGGTAEEFFAALHAEDHERVRLAIARTLADDAPYACEYRAVWCDGSVHHLCARGRVARAPDGRPLRFEGIVWDITERKLSEAALAETVQRLALATRSGRLAVWDWDLARNLMMCDEEMSALYGITRATFPSGIDAWLNGLHPDDKERVMAECQSAIAGTRSFDTTFRVRRPDGTVRHVEAHGLVLRDAAGIPVRMLGLNKDVTEARVAEEERARLQAQLQQAQRMESVGRLAGGVAHDFNNMLTVILGGTESVLARMAPADPLREELEEVMRAGRRSAELTSQLLAFARKQHVSPRVLDLNTAIEGMLRMLRRLIGENIDLRWLPAPELPRVLIDPSQVDQILANLCVNSRDAIVGVGSITIETRRRVIDAGDRAQDEGVAPGEYVEVSVTDDGCGMSAETLAHAFEPFFTTKAPGVGTGLGLATVYGIVKQNGGIVELDSDPGCGTSVSFALPARADATAGRVEQPATAAPGGSETILLVEDEPAILRSVRRGLERHGYAVLAARGPREAVRLAREHQGELRLVITDVIMSEGNGRDLVQTLSQLRPGIKCLFMSGYTADVIANHGSVGEDVAFIQKPFTTAGLAARVREVLDEGSSAEPG